MICGQASLFHNPKGLQPEPIFQITIVRPIIISGVGYTDAIDTDVYKEYSQKDENELNPIAWISTTHLSSDITCLSYRQRGIAHEHE